MKKLLILTAVSLSVFATVSTAASISSLGKKPVTTMISDKTITSAPVITMDDQLVANTFTGYFAKDGKIDGKLNNKPDNGPQTDSGTWQVNADGTICVTWQHWNNSQPVCVSAYKVGNGLLLVNAKSHKFETLLLNSDMKDGNQLN